MAILQIQHRNDTAANWTTNDPVLLAGEFGYETDTDKLKVGDGASLWSALSYLSSSTKTLTNKTITDYTNKVHADAVRRRIKNNTGVTITKGACVKFVAYNAGEDAIEVALANQATDVAIGLLNEDILTATFGEMIVSGILEGFDTSSFTQGSILFVNGAGVLTATEPSSGFSQPIALVLRSHAINGTVQVLASYPKQDAADVRYTGTLASTSVAAALNEVDTQMDSYQLSSEKDVANGYAGLTASGLIDVTQLPQLAITSTFVVNSEVNQLALSIQEGDVAVRSDENLSYIALNDTNATIADWQVLLSPTDSVQSVAGKIGIVALELSDLTDSSSVITTGGGQIINGQTQTLGLFLPASNVSSTTYTNAAIQVRELNFASSQTGADTESPRISFHWAGRVASQIGMGSDGVIRTFDNPGTGYQDFKAKDITSTGTTTATTFSGALNGSIASATTATTQTSSDDSTKVATTAFVKAASSTSNTTWTPVITDATLAATVATTFSYQIGRVTKVGSMVSLSFKVGVSAAGAINSLNDVYIIGLPYACTSDTYSEYSGFGTISGGLTGHTSGEGLGFNIVAGNSYLRVFTHDVLSSLTYIGHTEYGTGKYFTGSITYYTDD